MAVYSTRMNAAIWTAALASLCALGATPAGAQVSTLEVKKPAAATHAYWTAATLVNAKPLMLPHVAVDLSKPVPLGAPSAGGLQAPSQPPTVNVLPDYGNALFVPRSIEPPLMVPNMFGTSPGYRFTSARLTIDAAAALGAESKFPNALNGQLFFTVPSGTAVPPGAYVCSATVQRARIITTAGHCVSDGNGHFFQNWVFVPALRNGLAPFGLWQAVFIAVANTWHQGGGGVPNAQDVAVLELHDNASGKKIGQVTGTAGYRIPGLYGGQHVTATGYPCNLDSCNKIHRVDAEARAANANTAVIGSDMRGGASGGGWFLNWGEYASGQPPASGQDSGALRLIAVTSYGPVSASLLYNGASILDNRYVNGNNNGVLNVACAHRFGNC